MTAVDFGLFLPTRSFADARVAALQAERDGFYSVSLNDHFVPQAGSSSAPQLECMTALTAIGALTDRIRLAPTMLAASFRSPALLAKMVATLDQVTGGRFTLGIGAGWHRDEYDAHGYPFPSPAERLDRLDETIHILKAMWTEQDPVYRGRHFSIEHASSQPRPVQVPYPPIMIGGSSAKLLDIAARHADIVNLIPPTSNGKDFVKDQQAATAFDARKLADKISAFQDLVTRHGRPVESVRLSSFSVLSVRAPHSAPGVPRAVQRLGFHDEASARHSPVVLYGTPGQIREEIDRRVAEFGLSYFVVVPSTEDCRRLFVEEVLPAFRREDTAVV